MKIQASVYIIFLAIVVPKTCYSQIFTADLVHKIEVSAQVGWLFAGSNPGAKIINKPIYSLSVAYVRNPQVAYELHVNTFYSSIVYNGYQSKYDTTARYSQSYAMFGIVRSFTTEIKNFTPYLSSLIGFSNTSIKSNTTAPQTQLAAGLLGGVKYQINKRIGIKLQARVQAPLSGIGIGLRIGTGGPSVGIGSYSQTIQFDLSGGMFLNL
jgi:hypothetical protein